MLLTAEKMVPAGKQIFLRKSGCRQKPEFLVKHLIPRDTTYGTENMKKFIEERKSSFLKNSVI